MSAFVSYLIVNSARRTSGTYSDFEIPLAHTALKGVKAVELVSVQIPLGDESPIEDDLYAFIRIKEFSSLQMREARTGDWATFYVPSNGAESGLLSYEPKKPQRAEFLPEADITSLRVELIRMGSSGPEVISLGADWTFVLKTFRDSSTKVTMSG